MQNKKIKYCLVIILLTFFSLQSFSQIKDDKNQLSKKQLKEHKTSYINKAEKNGIINAQEFYKYKININKINELKKEGIDLALVSEAPIKYYEKSLYPSAIVLGTVVKRTYLPGENNHFHTSYKIEVSEVIKGQIRSNFVTIKTKSGLVDAENDSYIVSNLEPTLYLGEKALLMIHEIDAKSIEENTKKYTPEKKDQVINVDSLDYYVFWKYSLKGNNFLNEQNKIIGLKKDVIEKIQKIDIVNNTNDFYKLNFK